MRHTLWQALEREIEQYGIAAVAADVERISNRLTADVADILGGHPKAPAHELRPGDCSRASWIIRLTNELLDASASAQRAAKVARDLAEMESNLNRDGTHLPPPNTGGPNGR